MADIRVPVALPTPAQNLAGIAAMSASMAGLTVNDTFVKLAAATLPTGELISLRGIMAATLIGLIGLFTGTLGGFRHLWSGLVGLRLIGEVGATALFVVALIHMPLANATMILQAVPLTVTAGAALFLGAPVGWRRWIAVSVGFAGVVLIVRPGAQGFDAWSLFALGAVAFVTLRDLVTRILPLSLSTTTLTFFTMLVMTLLGFAFMPFETWRQPTASELGYVAVSAVFILVGYFFIIMSLRIADMGVVSPFRYSAVVWALVIGYLVWGDVPSLATLIGAVVVVATGVYTFHRERIAMREPGRSA